MKADVSKMIEDILILRYRMGYSSPSLVKYLKDTYDVCSSRAYGLIKEAREMIGMTYNEVNKEVLQESIIILESMREKAIGSGNDKLALEVQKELNKVNQLHIIKVEGNIKVEMPLFPEISDEDSIDEEEDEKKED